MDKTEQEYLKQYARRLQEAGGSLAVLGHLEARHLGLIIRKHLVDEELLVIDVILKKPEADRGNRNN